MWKNSDIALLWKKTKSSVIAFLIAYHFESGFCIVSHLLSKDRNQLKP